MLEIEKKFLLPPCKAKRYLKALGAKYKKAHILQYYADGMRFRKIGDRYYRTLKRGEGITREEIEEEIGKRAFYTSLAHKEGSFIEKYRYTFQYKGRTYEMDEFANWLEGLLYLEVEFTSLADAHAFTPPKKIARFVLEEVTNLSSFTNGSLALYGIPTIDTPFDKLIASSPSNPLSASIKIDYHPFTNVHVALRAWIWLLMKVIAANKEAILQKDNDPERLHQLRVALRKIRSISQFFDNKELATLAKIIMKKTNEARDLDVYIIWIEQYEKLLPKKLANSLQPLKSQLQKRRKEAYHILVQSLQSKEFAYLLSKLQSFSQKEPTKKIPAIIVGKDLINKQLKKVIKKARSLSSHSKPHTYHLLRIQIKKLRYLLEFFSPIFDQKNPKIIKKIKKFQEILGTHQDFMVQITYIESIIMQTELSKKEHKALSLLRKNLQSKAKSMRKKFMQQSPSLIKLSHQLQKALCRIS